MFKIYDELVTPIEGACSRYMTVRSRQKRGRRVEDVRRIGIATRGGVFKIYGEPESPHEVVCLTCMRNRCRQTRGHV